MFKKKSPLKITPLYAVFIHQMNKELPENPECRTQIEYLKHIKFTSKGIKFYSRLR